MQLLNATQSGSQVHAVTTSAQCCAMHVSHDEDPYVAQMPQVEDTPVHVEPSTASALERASVLPESRASCDSSAPMFTWASAAPGALLTFEFELPQAIVAGAARIQNIQNR
jgi:hypothetical protein